MEAVAPFKEKREEARLKSSLTPRQLVNAYSGKTELSDATWMNILTSEDSVALFQQAVGAPTELRTVAASVSDITVVPVGTFEKETTEAKLRESNPYVTAALSEKQREKQAEATVVKTEESQETEGQNETEKEGNVDFTLAIVPELAAKALLTSGQSNETADVQSVNLEKAEGLIELEVKADPRLPQAAQERP
ncbi:MAG: hypothetical protein MHM6MM_001525 [Cercozoa sp. M6MM]